MLRLAPLVLLLLLAGCASPDAPAGTMQRDDQDATATIDGKSPAGDASAPAPAADDWVVTATRVEPRRHDADWSGTLGARPCKTDGSEACRGSAIMASGVAAGVTWDEPVKRFVDHEALFWRLDVQLDWKTSNPLVPGLELVVYATTGCGECEPRLVQAFTGESPVVVRAKDIFVETGETGISLVVRPSQGAIMESTWSAAAVEVDLRGFVSSYVPVSEPVVLQTG